MGEVIRFPKTPKPTAKRRRRLPNTVAVNGLRPGSVARLTQWAVQGRPDLVRYEIILPRGAGLEKVASLLGIKAAPAS
jgi:hypothetical protein